MRDRPQPMTFANIPCWDPPLVNVIVETPRGSRNKYAFSEDLGVFELHRVLPAGSDFPYDFGFVPNTLAEDGDPIDVLLLMDQPAVPGCLVKARVVGILEATQKEDGRKERNDRVIAVAKDAHDYSNVRTLDDINPHLLDELEEFFVVFHSRHDQDFKVLGRRGPRARRRRPSRRAEKAYCTGSTNGTSKRRRPTTRILLVSYRTGGAGIRRRWPPRPGRACGLDTGRESAHLLIT